jgi:hypothetical protein
MLFTILPTFERRQYRRQPARADTATSGTEKSLHALRSIVCCRGMPNMKAITACLRRQKANLGEGCRAVFGR